MPKPFSLPRSAQFADHIVRGQKFRVARFPLHGAGRSRPLLFFSGLGANVELLAPFLERLGGREVITFDMPGLGGSAEHSTSYRLPTMADIAAEIFDNLGFDEIDVMGVSWGGMLAQEFAYRHSGTVNRLVLAATSAGFPMIPGRLSSLLKMVTSHRYTDPGARPTFIRCTAAARPGWMAMPHASGHLVRRVICINCLPLPAGRASGNSLE